MDIEQYLIILKKEDKTVQIKKYVFEGENIKVTFGDSFSKTYTYSSQNFYFSDEAKLLEETEIRDLRICNIANIEKIIKFGKYYRIFFKNKKVKIFLRDEIFVCEKVRDIFNYCKAVADVVGLKTEDGENFLAKEYDKITKIHKESVLYRYLNSNYKPNFSNKDKFLIYPFGTNKSQYTALKNALTEQISIIEGPPGTGKTQTILNIAINIVFNGQKLAIISNNNSATKNVLEKLKDYNLDFICAFLGSRENKENFIENQPYRPEFRGSDSQQKKFLQDEFKNLNEKLQMAFELENARAKLQSQFNALELEYKHFIKEENLKIAPKMRKKLKSEKIMDLIVKLQENQRINFWLKLQLVWFYGIGDFNFYKNTKQDIILAYNEIYYIIKQEELKTLIQTYDKKLIELDKNTLHQKLKENSFKLFHLYLQERYANKKREEFHIANLGGDNFFQEYPIILSTTYSLKNCLDEEDNFLIDYIIIDEASQVDLSTAVLALSCAKNAVIVGDTKQLPNVIESAKIKEIQKLNKQYHINENFNYINQNILSSMVASLEVPKVLLKEHYRSHPKIIEFCNQKFYNNELIIFTEDKGEKDVLEAYITQKGNHARENYNMREIEVISQEIKPSLKLSKEQIGIISPYNAQKEKLKKYLQNENIQIDTIHKYQGREKQAIIITTVANDINAFIDDFRILNVAVSRAKRYLRIVTSDCIAQKDSNIRDLLAYIHYNNFSVKQSNIKSIFDLLYRANQEARLRYLKNKKRISQFDSENLMFNLLQGLIDKEYNFLSCAVHIPLIRLLNNTQLLNTEEKRYANNILSHIDFILYRKTDKSIVLAIEVDGYSFHKEESIQYKRDRLKDSILEKYNIPLLRLNTINSDEARQISVKLKEVLC